MKTLVRPYMIPGNEIAMLEMTRANSICSIRVPSRILSNMVATSLVVNSGIFRTSSGRRDAGNLSRRSSVRARPVTVNYLILENGNTPLTSPAREGRETASPPNSSRHSSIMLLNGHCEHEIRRIVTLAMAVTPSQGHYRY